MQQNRETLDCPLRGARTLTAMTRREEALLSGLSATVCLVLLAFLIGSVDLVWTGGWYSLAAILAAGSARLLVNRRSVALSVAMGVVVSLGCAYLVARVALAQY